MWDGRLDCVNLAKHHITFIARDVCDINSALYCRGPEAQDLRKAKIDKLLGITAIESIQSEWASPIVSVRRKDCALHFCMDYRNLKAVTTTDAYPFPGMAECSESLARSTFF